LVLQWSPRLPLWEQERELEQDLERVQACWDRFPEQLARQVPGNEYQSDE
jgi:hypothetical protein